MDRVSAARNFCWCSADEPRPPARATARGTWRGTEWTLALDGLQGLDGRLDAEAMAAVAPALQQLMLHGVAADLCGRLPHGPVLLAEFDVHDVTWLPSPQPMLERWAFRMRAPGAAGVSTAALQFAHDFADAALFDALAADGWPVPATEAQQPGRLRLGRVRLLREELAGLAAGDLVWLDGTEVQPDGLRAQFVAADRPDACVWLKRSEMRRDHVPPARWAADPAGEHALADGSWATLDIWSSPMVVSRAWLFGGAAAQRLPASALSIRWTAKLDGEPAFDARLMPVGRRIGLQVLGLPARAAAARDATGS